MIGFVGLGQMGAPMARHLLDWPGGLVVCDVRPDATAELADAGARVAATPKEVAERADVISVMVLDDAQVDDVVSGILAAGRSGIVVAVHSTIRPGTAERLAERCRPQGVEVVDAPVSGGFMGAHDGRLAVMVGGADDAVTRCREPFAAWSEMFVHLGPVGAGTRGKLARNLLTFVSYAAAAEAQRLAEAAGISLRDLGQVVRHSDAITGGPGAIIVRDTTAPLAPDDGLHDIFRHARDLAEKDLELAIELGADLGVEVPFARLALDHVAAGLGVPYTEEEEKKP